MTSTRPRRSFGQARKLPSGKFQARYQQPGSEQFVNAPRTFATKKDADAWLTLRKAEMIKGDLHVRLSPTKFRDYAQVWMTTRPRPLKPRTIDSYNDLLNRHILPALGDMKLRDATPELISKWYAGTALGKPTYRARAYSLLKSIFQSAVNENMIASNPCRIVGAGQAKRVSKTEPATLDQLKIIVGEMPQRYRLMIMLAAWCAMRFGELTELRVSDVDLNPDAPKIKIRRAVSFIRDKSFVDDDSLSAAHVDTPKSEAGKRDVPIPPHLLPFIEAHISEECEGPQSLLFPSARDKKKHMRPPTMNAVYWRARTVAKRSDLRFHDLRHTGATLYAQSGATLAELMEILGHTSPAAALRYQHAAQGRTQLLAKRLSAMAGEK